MIKPGKEDLIQNHHNRTIAMRFHSWAEKLGLIPNIAWTGGNLQPGNKVGVDMWKIVKS